MRRCRSRVPTSCYMTHSRGRALGSVGAVAVSLACLLATGCRPEIEWGSRAVLLNETTLLRSFTEIEGVGRRGETHLAPEGTVFLQLEFLDIYDGTEYTRLPRSPVPFIIAPGGEEYRPRSMVMVWLAASTPMRGQPVLQVVYPCGLGRYRSGGSEPSPGGRGHDGNPDRRGNAARRRVVCSVRDAQIDGLRHYPECYPDINAARLL